MSFSSIIFLFGFLPAALLLHFISPVKMRNAVLLLLSLFFYTWGEVGYAWILGVSILVNYAGALLIDRWRNRLAVTAAVALNIGLLVLFKYLSFLTESLNIVFRWFHVAPITDPGMHLPIGISFYTFKAVSYLIDVYRKEVSANRNLFHVALYLSLFPNVTAGPIDRYKGIAEAIRHRSITLEGFATGVQRFIIGLGKKVLLASTLAGTVDRIYQIPPSELTTVLSWFAAVCYTLQIYFDFSGYTDMAVGLGQMFGFRLMENFDFPYRSASIQEFWRRWHISLSTWFRDYLYIPLGGNRKGEMRTYINLAVVFFLCGLWHGANWTFVIWGLFHGLFLILERAGLAAWLKRTWKPIAHVYAMLVVTIGWVFFRSASLGEATGMLKAMFGAAQGDGVAQPFEFFWDRHIGFVLVCSIAFSMPVSRWLVEGKEAFLKSVPEAYRNLLNGGWEITTLCGLLLVMIASMASVAAGVYQPFIYFKF
uniref:MBOAT family protein n=1 Tax=Desulfatirhabdium butyrativorans TaxID=340467 RepID=A0A7C4RSF3_9BACT